MIGLMILMLFVIYPSEPVTMNDDLSKLYAVIEDDAEVVISTPTDAHTGAEEVEVEEIATEEIKGAYFGTYELTAYIETGNPCADGEYPQVGHTAACNDPALWHKWVHIEGYGDYYIHDTGGMASNVIDIFVGSYDEAIQFGRREAEVYIIGD